MEYDENDLQQTCLKVKRKYRVSQAHLGPRIGSESTATATDDDVAIHESRHKHNATGKQTRDESSVF